MTHTQLVVHGDIGGSRTAMCGTNITGKMRFGTDAKFITCEICKPLAQEHNAQRHRLIAEAPAMLTELKNTLAWHGLLTDALEAVMGRHSDLEAEWAAFGSQVRAIINRIEGGEIDMKELCRICQACDHDTQNCPGTECVECGHRMEVDGCDCIGNPHLNFRRCACVGGHEELYVRERAERDNR